MKFPYDQFAHDWMTLHEWYVLARPSKCEGDWLELEEDWDHLRGRDSWFVALFEGDIQIPGTLRRFELLPSWVHGVNSARPSRPSHIGHWKAGEKPKLVKLSKEFSIGHITVSDYLYVQGGEVGYQMLWTVPITLTNRFFVTDTGNVITWSGTTSTGNAGNITITSFTFSP